MRSEEAMYDLHRCLDVQLRAMNKTKQTLIFPEAEDPRTIEAAERLTKFANVVLLTTEPRLRSLLENSRVVEKMQGTRERFLKRVKCVDIQEEVELREEFADTFVKCSEGKKWAVDHHKARELLLDPVYFSVLATRLGYADTVLGGLVHASRDFFSPCLRLLEKQAVVYEMALFSLPDDHTEVMYKHNLVMFADVALNPIPTAESLAEIAVGACRTMRDIIPKEDLEYINGALLSYSTRGSGEGPSVQRIRKAAGIIPGMLASLRRENPIYESIRIVPELQISVAVSESMARSKLGQDQLDQLPGAGGASVLVAPNLDVGNLMYHIYATRYPQSQHLLFIGGLNDRALDFSRSSSADDLVLGAKGVILRAYKSSNYRPTPKDYFFPRHSVLSINPGSTSTKIAMYEGDSVVFEEVVRHKTEELLACQRVVQQRPLRMEVIRKVLARNNVDLKSLDAVVARGGLVKPLTSGTYRVNQKMLNDLAAGTYGEHPSNLGAPIACELVADLGVLVPAYVVDPPVVDELDDTARITGIPGVQRRAAWHALNQKACARRYAEERGFEVEQVNLIVAHLGGGISVGAHKQGRCVFVRDALYDGPMSTQRVGSVPRFELLERFLGSEDKQEVYDFLVRKGGLLAHLGTSDIQQVEKAIDAGEPKAAVVYDAMIQQIAMEISSLIPKFEGQKVDRIIITGGMAHSRRLTKRLSSLLSQVGVLILVWPGEDELAALRDGALRVLLGHEPILEYDE
jgi:butyrate kinase